MIASVVACAPDPESDPSVVRDLRVLALATERPGTPLPLGPPDEARPLYTFAEAPPPAEMRALVVDPRAPTAPVRYWVAACPAIFGPCEAGARTTRPVVVGGEAAPEIVSFTFAPTVEDLNAWLAADPWAGFDRLAVRIELEVEGFDGLHARTFAVMSYYGHEIELDARTGRRERREPEPAPRGLDVQGGVDGRDVDLLAGGVLEVEPGGRLGWTVRRDEVFAHVDYLLPDAPGTPVRRVFDSTALVVGLYAVRGRVLTAQTLALRGAWLDYRAPERATAFPDALYVVASDGLGGVAFARWQVVCPGQGCGGPKSASDSTGQ
jgi:hypothetical protein